MSTPDIAVVVASHDRPLRLRWLLNALEEQTLPRERWEVVVGHDSVGPETAELLTTHPLALAGNLRHVTLPPGSAPPGANRNAALKVIRAPLVAFTDDDCRPPREWLANALSAARRNPGAIVQGATTKDPVEHNIESATHFHSQLITPPTPWAECCNIVYPRELLERVGGFREDTYTGEDTEMFMRCKALGAELVGAPEVLTYHAIVETTFLRRLRGIWRWQDLPILLKRHPAIRRQFPLWIFWKRTHVWLPFFGAGVYLGQRRGLQWTLLCLPWLVHGMPRHGTNPRGRYRNFLELPSRLTVDVTEFAALTVGSVKHRSMLL
jgi:glycosyltransferase involved in cell wall biosynthesis